MSPVEKFNQGLQTLNDHLAALAALTEQQCPPADDVLLAARWTIVRSLAEMATFKEKYLLAPIDARGDAALAAQAKAIGDAMQNGMQKLIDHAQRWPPQAVRDDWSGYRQALRVAHGLIRDHFAWEARVIPPILAILEGASAAPKRNWTRPVWGVQESLSKR